MKFRPLSQVLNVAVAIVCFGSALDAHAQVWPVRAMLDKVSSPYIHLRDKDGGFEKKSVVLGSNGSQT